MILMNVNGLCKAFGARPLFADVRFTLSTQDRLGLVGVNGCGKTTLLKILEGLESADAGSVSLQRETRLGSMAQSVANASDTLYASTLGVFSELIALQSALDEIERALSAAPADPMPMIARQQALQERLEAGGGLTYQSRTRATLLGLGFSEAELAQPLETMSGGQRNKAQLARLLLSGANLLLLDEPTNHLDINAIRYLEDYLCSFRGALIVVSHDRYFLDKVTNRTMELKNGRMTLSQGNYTRHIELQSTAQELLRRRYAGTQKEIRRIEGIVAQQRHFGQAHNFITIASKQKQIERLRATLIAPEKEPESIRFHFSAREVGGNDVLLCEGLKKTYDKPVFSDVSLHIRRGERVFLLGANGCGKTTLLRLIMGRETPDAGSITLGSHVHAGYYEQHMRGLREENTVVEEISDAYPKLTLTQIRNALAAFLFRGDDAEKTVSMLSGGERARMQLLKLMLSGDNLLLLDEPTNHLDIASREALERALEEHEGTMLIVTHDRYLVNRLADRVLVLGEQGITEYIGGYDDYLAALAQTASASAEAPAKAASDYRLQRQRQSELHFAQGRLSRAEARVAEAEAQLSALRQSMAAAAADYEKARSLCAEAEKKQAEIDLLYEDWTQAQEALDALLEKA